MKLNNWCLRIPNALNSTFFVDVILAVIIFVISFVLFSWNFNHLGFYSDDAGFFYSLGSSNLVQTLNQFISYVPGRNLHIIWQKIIFIIVGWQPQNLPFLHLTQSFCESLVSVLFFYILRRFEFKQIPAFVAAVLFSLWPTRNDVHFWISSLPMNIFSTAFFLLFIFTTQSLFKMARAIGRKCNLVKLVLLDSLFFVLAIFTYDQVFFSLLFILTVRFCFFLWKRNKSIYRVLLIQLIAIAVIVSGYLYIKTNYSRIYGGPVFSMESLNRIIPNLKYSLNLNFIDMNINFAPLSEEILNNTQKIAINISYGAILVVLFFLLSQRLKALSLVSFEKNKQNVVLMIVAFVLFFLSYLPVYIWYISTRHNYLPTVFIGFFIAAILSIVDVCLRNKQISLIIFWIFIFIVPFRIAYYDFEDNIYKSSNVWSKSYEIRRSFYFNLVQKGVVSDNTKCIVIKNAPEIYKIAPFFASEQVSISLDYLTNKSLKNSTKDCENLIVYHNECYNIKSDYFEFENRITVVQVSPFNQAKDSMLAYSVIPKCE